MVARLPRGFAIGHWEDREALTGCTVILCPIRTVGGCDVRGSSPGSRELALLASEKSMKEVTALLLTGGSAFGLAAADGVVRYLEENGRGYKTPWGIVPIVPAAVIFDLNIGSASVRPTDYSGYDACRAAEHAVLLQGNVGAGTGATVGKWGGMENRMKGGVGVATLLDGDLVVAAVAVVNAVGDVLDESGHIIAGARSVEGRWIAQGDPLRRLRMARPPDEEFTNTTLVAVLTNALLSKVDVNRVAQRGNDGMARAVKPVHTSYDGDVVFALASCEIKASMDLVAEMGADAVAQAIRNGVLHASPAGGVAAAGPGRSNV